jgi:hypothetical protein
VNIGALLLVVGGGALVIMGFTGSYQTVYQYVTGQPFPGGAGQQAPPQVPQGQQALPPGGGKTQYNIGIQNHV